MTLASWNRRLMIFRLEHLLPWILLLHGDCSTTPAAVSSSMIGLAYTGSLGMTGSLSKNVGNTFGTKGFWLMRSKTDIRARANV